MAGVNMFVISRTSETSMPDGLLQPNDTCELTIACDIDVRVQAAGPQFQLQAGFSTASNRILLFGPSGSGKSLTLLALAGLLTPRAGRIVMRGRTFF